MKNTATKARTEDTKKSVARSKVASKAFATNTQHKNNIRQHQSLAALYVKGATGCGNAVSLRKRPPRREPRSWLKHSSFFLFCMFRQCPSPRKCKKDGCKSSHYTLLHGAESTTFHNSQRYDVGSLWADDNS